jgi:hypothetical protein
MNDLCFDKKNINSNIPNSSSTHSDWTPTTINQMQNILKVWLKILEVQPDILNESEVHTTKKICSKKIIKKG